MMCFTATNADIFAEDEDQSSFSQVEGLLDLENSRCIC